MDRRHKDLLRRTVGELRRALAGGEDTRDEGQRGDLDRELERLGIAPDGTRTPLSVLPALTGGERRAQVAAVAAMADAPAERLAPARPEVVERAARGGSPPTGWPGSESTLDGRTVLTAERPSWPLGHVGAMPSTSRVGA